jgi:hypothetical protein
MTGDLVAAFLVRPMRSSPENNVSHRGASFEVRFLLRGASLQKAREIETGERRAGPERVVHHQATFFIPGDQESIG